MFLLSVCISHPYGKSVDSYQFLRIFNNFPCMKERKKNTENSWSFSNKFLLELFDDFLIISRLKTFDELWDFRSKSLLNWENLKSKVVHSLQTQYLRSRLFEHSPKVLSTLHWFFVKTKEFTFELSLYVLLFVLSRKQMHARNANSFIRALPHLIWKALKALKALACNKACEKPIKYFKLNVEKRQT